MRKIVLGIGGALSSIMLISCSLGNGSTQTQPTDSSYGIVQSASGAKNFSLSSLQSFALSYYGICSGIHDLTSPQCLSNFAFVNSPSNATLFGSGFNITSFVKTNAAASGVSGVNAYRITYNSPGQPYVFAGGSAPNLTVSGLVLVPTVQNPGQIKGIVIYYHGTILSKYEVPSNLSGVLASQNIQNTLASTYAADGYIVIAPDYPGQGVDVNTVHPYVIYPKSNALSGLYMLNAARSFLANQGVVSQSQALKLYITSYSEGAIYAIWASRYLQGQYADILTNNNLSLVRTVGGYGPYDLSGAMLNSAYTNLYNTTGANAALNAFNVSPGLASDSSLYAGVAAKNPKAIPAIMASANLDLANSKANLGGDFINAYISYNSTPAANDLVLLPTFNAMTTCFNTLGYLKGASESPAYPCTPPIFSLPQLFNNTNLTGESIGTTIAFSALGSTYGTTNYFTSGKSFSDLAAYLYSGAGPSNNSVIALISDIRKDPTIMGVIKQADTYQFHTNSPISFLYLKYDSTVTNLNSLEACSNSGVLGMSAAGMVSCKMIDNTNAYTDATIPLVAPTPAIPATPTTPAVPATSAIYGPTVLSHGQSEFMLNLAMLGQF